MFELRIVVATVVPVLTLVSIIFLLLKAAEPSSEPEAPAPGIGVDKQIGQTMQVMQQARDGFNFLSGEIGRDRSGN